jgi:PAS domain S-box-containing protein
MSSDRAEEPLWQLTDEVREQAIVLLDPQGAVASWHDGARAITGHAAHEIIGTHFSRFYLPEAIEAAWPELELEVAAVEGRFGGVGWRVRQDGSQYWAEVVLMALRDRNGELRGFGHVIRDTPQTGRAKPLPGAACQTNELIAMLSHELRNPLAPIRNAVYLMRRKHLDEQLWKAYIQLAQAEAAFRIQKDQLRVRPIWHQRADRMQAHILVCFLAFVLWKTLELWQQRAGLGNSPRTVLEELGRIQSHDVILPTATHGEIRLRCITQPDPAQAALLERLGVVLPRRMRLSEHELPAAAIIA